MDIMEQIKEQIETHDILLYMKGTPHQPQCGFSRNAVQVLSACGEKFAYVDILAHPDIRANLPKYANWPTFPQLWIGGELVGGSDIIASLYESKQLQEMIAAVTAKGVKANAGDQNSDKSDNSNSRANRNKA